MPFYGQPSVDEVQKCVLVPTVFTTQRIVERWPARYEVRLKSTFGRYKTVVHLEPKRVPLLTVVNIYDKKKGSTCN